MEPLLTLRIEVDDARGLYWLSPVLMTEMYRRFIEEVPRHPSSGGGGYPGEGHRNYLLCDALLACSHLDGPEHGSAEGALYALMHVEVALGERPVTERTTRGTGYSYPRELQSDVTLCGLRGWLGERGLRESRRNLDSTALALRERTGMMASRINRGLYAFGMEGPRAIIATLTDCAEGWRAGRLGVCGQAADACLDALHRHEVPGAQILERLRDLYALRQYCMRVTTSGHTLLPHVEAEHINTFWREYLET